MAIRIPELAPSAISDAFGDSRVLSREVWKEGKWVSTVRMCLLMSSSGFMILGLILELTVCQALGFSGDSLAALNSHPVPLGTATPLQLLDFPEPIHTDTETLSVG
ncbi:hypothetical protein P7K49_002849 [Saguinus oedipus]|uniref:Uncharacterized protein n=1 Tax=Saguinus oedipus TaxID=9490 RepID=A0ABQ9WL50_SAGOE|nr:hypothetical protein P7K49_002849 [Saguinus oedipus]